MPWQRVDGDFSLSLGGMAFRVLPDQPLVFPDPSDHYRNFLFADPDLSRESLVRINTIECPDVEKMGLLFDADDAWSLREDASGKYFVGHGPASLDGAPWVLKVEDDASATVYGNPKVVAEDGVVICPMMYPVDQLLCVNVLADNQGMIVHSAGLKIGGKVYLFPGKSGAGKSTISQCVGEGNGVSVLSDDRMIIRKVGEQFAAYGTPWPGDAGYAKNEHGVLGGVFFINHGSVNAVRPLTSSQALDRMMPVTSVPWFDQEKSGKVMNLMGDLATGASCCALDFKPDGDIGAFIRHEVAGDEA